jgi:hypothetical protein
MVSTASAVTIVDVIGNLPLANFNAGNYAGQTYKDWGNEPFVAVNPTNPNTIVVSGFAFGAPPNNAASLWYSTNGGNTWLTNFGAMPQPSANVGIPNDQTMAYDSSGTLHLAVLGGCGNCNVYSGTTTNIATTPVTWSASGAPVNNFPGSLNMADQPWIAVGNGKVAIAYDNFGTGSDTDPEMRMTLSLNNGTTFLAANDTAMSANGQVVNATAINPGNRIAMDGNGVIYSVFQYAGSANGGVPNVSYRLNYFSGGAWQLTGTPPAGNPGGLVLDTGLSDQGNSTSPNLSFGGVNMLRGGIDAIATDTNGQNVYVVYGKRDGTGTDRLYLADFNPATNTAVLDPTPISIAGQRSALPSITVLADGNIEVLYDTFDGNQFHVHLENISNRGGGNFVITSDQDIYDFVSPSLAALGIPGGDRALGDYQYITSLGNTFYGVFAGRGDTNAGGINTTALIDPFFITGSDAPEPSTLAFAAATVAGLLVARRRRA